MAQAKPYNTPVEAADINLDLSRFLLMRESLYTTNYEELTDCPAYMLAIEQRQVEPTSR